MRSTNMPLEHLKGPVERVVFHSETTGFCVLRVRIPKRRDCVTVTGLTASVIAGECIECSGSWVHDKKYGLQFKSQQLNTVVPTTLVGIEKYLASGMVKGIGVHFAKKLVEAFGENVFDIIENQSEKLLALEGIGPKRQQRIQSAWSEQREVRRIMVFLHSHGVGTSRAVHIYKIYGAQAVEKVRSNPYQLTLDIRGIGFKTADSIAQKLGISKNSPLRAQAGVRHVLQTWCQQGHCAAPHEQLIEMTEKLLEISSEIIEQAVQTEVIRKYFVLDNIAQQRCIFPASLYHAESSSARLIHALKKGMPPWGQIDCTKAIPWVEYKTNLQLSTSQTQAVATVLQHKISIITGGPGVGKTTIVNSILHIVRAKKCRVGLCAPTGRAAQRLTQSTQSEAKTIHRLLEFDPATYGFKYHQDHQLRLDVLVVDETSMIDTTLFYHLLKAVPTQAALIFVGDVDQLPSVGSGAVLYDLIASETITVVRLTEIFRQAQNSYIVVNAHRINQGKMPYSTQKPDTDFHTIMMETVEDIHDRLLSVVAQYLQQPSPSYSIMDIQVLTPMRRGGLGSVALNHALQSTFNNPSSLRVSRFGITFALGDKVIQTVNNYDKKVFNGDIGRIASMNLEEDTLVVQFDSRSVSYDFAELDEIELAYAISIHKSQGSEFPVVIIPLAMQHYVLLARNLLYTAVTRGQQRVILLAQKKAVSMAVNHFKDNKRLTNLIYQLRSPVVHDDVVQVG